MKTLKLNLVMIAVVIGTIGAFAFKSAHGATAGVSYYWYTTTSGSGASYQDQNTIADEQSVTGCSATNIFCEAGFTSSQLVDPLDPTKGVKAGQMPSTEIKHN